MDKTNKIEYKKELKDMSIGSGYKDLEGMVINYGYEDFDNFNLIISSNKLRWEGKTHYFKGIIFETSPTISKVADGIYFVSWTTGANGGDNVVFNINKKKVNSHLNPSDFDPDVMMMVHGTIFKLNDDALMPGSDITPAEKVYPIIKKNMETKKLPPLFNIKENKIARFSEDKIARKELANKTISYVTPDGKISLEIDGNRTYVSENNNHKKSYQTYATKISEGIYFISWKNNYGGNHVLFNINTMKAFDHLSDLGDRREKIYTITDFLENKK